MHPLVATLVLATAALLATPDTAQAQTESTDCTFSSPCTFAVGQTAEGTLSLNLEGTRQDPAGQQPVNQGLRLQVGWTF